MKYLVTAAVLVVCGLAAIWFTLGHSEQFSSGVNAAGTSESVTGSTTKRNVLVELFTSEGCSSCPPADRLLTSLATGGEVITLAYHVDYWNYLGWKDRFSSPEFTKRQEAYARQFRLDSTYTPQIVVDGSAEFVGSNRAKANEVIANAAAEPTGSIALSINGGNLSADIQGLSNHSDATVYLAVAESGLLTKVGGGENSGSTLEHSSVVRQMISIGKVKKGESSFTLERELPRNAGWKRENVKYVVFVQDNNNLKVLAVAATLASEK